MSYYFLTWDAKSGELGWAEEQAAELREKSRLSFLWSCGNTKRIESGDTVFFLRQRMEPRGIAGFGYVVKPPHSRPHWKPERRAAGATTLCVEVAWEYFELEPVVSRERLRTPPFDGVHWDAQRSGMSIPDDVGSDLEAAFLKGVGAMSSRLPEESQATTLPTGAKRTIVVNAYERNPQARRLCLDHHGFTCCVCRLSMEEKYGEAAKELIHVHHLTPVASINASAKINPMTDLRPVCPNCHAVIHRSDPPFSTEDVARMLQHD